MKKIFTTSNKTGTLLKLMMISVLAMILVTTAGCMSVTKISDIKSDTAKYEGKTVTIKGTVGESIWLATAVKGTYQVGDGSETIWVISTQPPPAKGASVTTEGTVQSAFTILGTSYGTVIQETKRH
jgi:ABC-type Fe3+-hydroxamate transport system substrate-binding protein